jgi:hypothetical protein
MVEDWYIFETHAPSKTYPQFWNHRTVKQCS